MDKHMTVYGDGEHSFVIECQFYPYEYDEDVREYNASDDDERVVVLNAVNRDNAVELAKKAINYDVRFIDEITELQ